MIGTSSVRIFKESPVWMLSFLDRSGEGEQLSYFKVQFLSYWLGDHARASRPAQVIRVHPGWRRRLLRAWPAGGAGCWSRSGGLRGALSGASCARGGCALEAQFRGTQTWTKHRFFWQGTNPLVETVGAPERTNRNLKGAVRGVQWRDHTATPGAIGEHFSWRGAFKLHPREHERQWKEEAVPEGRTAWASRGAVGPEVRPHPETALSRFPGLWLPAGVCGRWGYREVVTGFRRMNVRDWQWGETRDGAFSWVHGDSPRQGWLPELVSLTMKRGDGVKRYLGG